MRRAYVSAVRAVRAALRRTRVLAAIDRGARHHRFWLWLRSLLAIYDLADLRRLDVPWWTFRAADQVDAFLRERPGARVFEWGSGASTLWLAVRAGEVHSVEHDESWGASLAQHLPPNCQLTVVPPVRGRAVQTGSRKRGFGGLDFSDYVTAIDTVDGAFDVVVIDGRAREACLGRAVGRLASGGIIVFDNVERRRYRRAIGALGLDTAADDSWGLTPCLPYPTRTALIRVTGADEPA